MNNKNLKKIIKIASTAALISVLTFSFTACGKTNNQAEISENETIEVANVMDNSETENTQNTNDSSETSSEDETDTEVPEDENVQEGEDDAEDLQNNEEENNDYQEEYVNNNTSENVSNKDSEDTKTVENVKEMNKTTICIDAGHGGSNEGTKETYDGKLIKEKDINLVIAKKLKGYLEQNGNFNVIMTRNSDTDVSIDGRIEYAKANNADYVISVHINSKSQDNTNPRGCMVLMSCSRYQPANSRFSSIYDKEKMLADSIIRNLNSIGIPIANDWNTEYTNGILQRTNTVNELYPDGSLADYYGLIYNGTYAGIPTIIVEHSFLSNENDYRNHFSTDAQLDALARADAQGIMDVIE